MTSFHTYKDLSLPPALQQSLEEISFFKPTPIQSAAIPAALLGKDILATAQTGTGKTAAFGVPMITHIAGSTRRQALILAPTRELAAQIHCVLNRMSSGLYLESSLVVGGESFNRQADELDRGTHFVVATPGRLNDHLEEGTVNLSSIDMLVLDEIDRMLDMGFAPQIREIMKHIPKKRQTLLFSATLPDEITHLANAFLTDPVRIAIGPTTVAAAQVKEETIHTSQDKKISVLLSELKKRDGRILIFARTKSRTDRLARLLHREGYDVSVLHGGRNQGQRKRALEAFRSGRRLVMVATDLAGRGIDVPDIEHVINFDPPHSREDYIHRIGRTGRFGKSGHALNLVLATEVDGIRAISGEKKPSRVIYRSPRKRFRR